MDHFDREARERLLLAAARQVAARVGVTRLTHRAVAAACVPPCSVRTVQRWAPNRRVLRDKVSARNDTHPV